MQREINYILTEVVGLSTSISLYFCICLTKITRHSSLAICSNYNSCYHTNLLFMILKISFVIIFFEIAYKLLFCFRCFYHHHLRLPRVILMHSVITYMSCIISCFATFKIRTISQKDFSHLIL